MALKTLLQISMAAIREIGSCSSPFWIHCCCSTWMFANRNSGIIIYRKFYMSNFVKMTIPRSEISKLTIFYFILNDPCGRGL